MAERTLKVYEMWRESSQKFDFFMAGLISALLAFVGQSFSLQTLGLNAGTLEFLALLFLLVSFYYSLKRIESNTEAFRLMHKREHAEDQLIELRKFAGTNQVPTDIPTGEPLSTERVQELQQQYLATSNQANDLFKVCSDKGKFQYDWRNRLLISGFVLLFASRVVHIFRCAP